MMNDDMDLVREYAARQSEQAFATLVTRHVNLVHSAALRQVRDEHLAGEITQTVFLILARKAAGLSPKTILSGWLYRTTRFVGKAALKREGRRRFHEHQAHMQKLADPVQTEAPWEQWSPLLDEAMSHLRDQDRDALILRYFENRSLREVGSVLGVAERAAQKRVVRGLEKLRVFFARRGVTLTAVAIASAVSAHSVQAAPVGLIPVVTSAGVAHGVTASGSALTLINGALKIMAWTKLKVAIVVATGLILATSVSVVIIQRARLIQGKTESDWIKSIVYAGDDNQRHAWQSLGPRGTRMLMRALQTPPSGPGEEQQNTNRVMHMCAADLLCQLEDYAGENGYHADPAVIPKLIELLRSERVDAVRALELGCLEIPIKSMSEKQKAELFPELIRSLQSQDGSMRNNALVALQYYPDQSATVVPLLVNALRDSSAHIRMIAALALNKMDPATAAKSDIVQVLLGCLQDSSTANEATFALADLHRESDRVVPALIQSLQSDQAYVRGNSAAALGRFGAQAKAAVPALQQSLADSDAYVRRQAAAALKKIVPAI